MTRNEIILGVFALVLIVFSLVVALFVPRRDPDFPGRNLRLFALIAVLLVAAMLTAVEVFGGEDHEQEAAPTETGEPPGETGTTPTGTTPTETGDGRPTGDPAAGQQVFAAQACGSCHTLSAAGTTGTIGPNLDEALQGKDAAFIQESIVNPDAQIAAGYSPDLMPETFGELPEDELANLVAFLAQSAGG